MTNLLLDFFVTMTLWVLVSGNVMVTRMVTVDDYQRGYRFPYKSSNTTYTSSRIGCVEACSSDDTCNSVNIKKDAGRFLCEMSSEATGFFHTNKLVKNTEFRYYEKKTVCLNGGIWNASTEMCDDCKHLTWGARCENYVTDCKDAKDRFPNISDGRKLVLIKPNTTQQEFVVSCDMQWGQLYWAERRVRNEDENFTRGWHDYKSGFGDLKTFQGDFFLGLEKVHLISSQNTYRFKIWVHRPSGGGKVYVNYFAFTLGNESTSYIARYTGVEAEHPLLTDGYNAFGYVDSEINGAPFFTFDQDCPRKCAVQSKSGWWFNPDSLACPPVNLHAPQENLKWLWGGCLVSIDMYDFQLFRDP